MKTLLLIALATLGCQLDDDENESVATSAIDDDPDDDPPTNRCLEDTTGTLTASASAVVWPQPVTLTWKVTVPTDCSVLVFIGSTIVAKQSSMVVNPQPPSATYRLRVSVSGVGERLLQSRTVTTTISSQVSITANNQVPVFLHAVGQAGTTIAIANPVELDLSGQEAIRIASGVTIRGGRGGRQPGPRLFTTTRPRRLFLVAPGTANVRITGVRIDGGDIERNGDYLTRGITIDSATNIHVDHSELFGWGEAAIEVGDGGNTMGSPSRTATTLLHTVNIYDNYIHHNQSRDGYGVISGGGAHPYIARNTFNFNRHAIAGDGSDGNGYTAYHNLVLEDGGHHKLFACDDWWVPCVWVHTHQFDMHGILSCWGKESDCGPAGHTMLVRHNAFYYSHDDTIKLRGSPTVGMWVGQNVFAKDLSFSTATSQTESGLFEEPGNTYLYDGFNHLVTCDFDGDGLTDQFLATGQNWWYRSGGTAPWTFLNASTRITSQLTFGNFDGDNRCDVRADNVVFSGGKPPPGLPTGDGSWSW